MGTRSLFAIVSGTDVKFSQSNGHDGYLSGIGLELINSLRSVDVAQIEANLEKAIQVGNDYDIERIPMINIITLILEGAEIKWSPASFNFASDSLYCEWAYILDLKTQKFEIYKGFVKSELADDERFKFMENLIDLDPPEGCSIYYPVRHFKTYDLAALPTEDEMRNLDKQHS